MLRAMAFCFLVAALGFFQGWGVVTLAAGLAFFAVPVVWAVRVLLRG